MASLLACGCFQVATFADHSFCSLQITRNRLNKINTKLAKGIKDGIITHQQANDMSDYVVNTVIDVMVKYKTATAPKPNTHSATRPASAAPSRYPAPVKPWEAAPPAPMFGRFSAHQQLTQPTALIRPQMQYELGLYLSLADEVNTCDLQGSDQVEAQEATKRAFTWMQDRSMTFPTMCPMYCDFAAFQVTSVSSERAFSVLNNRVLSKTTNRRSQETLQALMCLGSWMRASRDEDDPLADLRLLHVIRKGGAAKERYERVSAAIKSSRPSTSGGGDAVGADDAGSGSAGGGEGRGNSDGTSNQSQG